MIHFSCNLLLFWIRIPLRSSARNPFFFFLSFQFYIYIYIYIYFMSILIVGLLTWSWNTKEIYITDKIHHIHLYQHYQTADNFCTHIKSSRHVTRDIHVPLISWKSGLFIMYSAWEHVLHNSLVLFKTKHYL